MPCGWEGNRRSGVALAMRHRLQQFIHLMVHGLRQGDEQPPVLLIGHGTFAYPYTSAVPGYQPPSPLQRKLPSRTSDPWLWIRFRVSVGISCCSGVADTIFFYGAIN